MTTVLLTLLAVYICGGLITMGLFLEWSKKRDDEPGKLAVVIGAVMVFFTWPALIVAVAKFAFGGKR